MQQNSESDHIQLDLQTNSRKFHVLVGLTGSVAALKAPLLVTQLLEIPGVSVYIQTVSAWVHRATAVIEVMFFNITVISHVYPLGGAICYNIERYSNMTIYLIYRIQSKLF